MALIPRHHRGMATNKTKTQTAVSVMHPSGHEPEVERRMRDINLAMKRLGGVDERCRWLLEEFAMRDPAQLSTAERALVRDNLAALAFGMPQIPATTNRRVGWGFDDRVLTDDRSLRAVWRSVRNYADAHRAPFGMSFGGTFKRLETPGPYVRLHLEAQARGLANALRFAVVEVLSACTRLRECPECHRLFVARRRQERHPKCARQRRDRNRPSRRKSAKKGA